MAKTCGKFFNGINSCKLYIGGSSAKIIIGGNFYGQLDDNVQFIDDILYVNNINMNYNEEEKTLHIDEAYLNYDSIQYNLRIEGDK